MRVISLEACGCNILMVSEDEAGRLDLHEALAALGNEGFASIYAEGGPIVAHSLLLAGLVDRFFWFQSERRLKNGVKSPISDDVLEDFDLLDRRRVGTDRLLTYMRKGL